MSGKLDEQTLIAASGLADSDRMYVADMSQMVGLRDRNATIATLVARLGGSAALITQAAHGLSVGDAIRHDGTAYVQSTADTASNAVVAAVVAAVPDTNTFLAVSAGVITGLSGLTAGSPHYLQDDGSLAVTAGSVNVPVLLATSSTAGILLSFGGGNGGLASINTQTGTAYTLAASDNGALVTLSNASAITVTVPPNSGVAIDIGAFLELSQLGAGTVTVSPGTGVTINSLAGNTSISGQYGSASLVKIGTDTWLLSGDLA